jgi:hypothetical protein
MTHDFKVEKNKVDALLKSLSKWFYYETEVWSISGKSRIDVVLKCKKTNAIFGVEVKSDKRKRGHDWAQFLMQAKRYSDEKFVTSFAPNPISLLVFITPAMGYYYKNVFVESKQLLPFTPEGENIARDYQFFASRHGTEGHCNVNTFIGEAFNVGEIRRFEFIAKNEKYNLPIFIYRGFTIWKAYPNGCNASENMYNKYSNDYKI